ncbi:MAG: hypothetical protein ACOCYG_09700 [Spirochaetota bacterium]
MRTRIFFSLVTFAPALIIVTGCTDAGAGGGTLQQSANPLADVENVEFATFGDTATSSASGTMLSVQAGSASSTYSDATNINQSLTVTLVNLVISEVRSRARAGDDLAQPFHFQDTLAEDEVQGVEGTIEQHFTIQLNESESGYTFHGFESQRSYDSNGDLDASSSWDDAPIELRFNSDLTTAQFVLKGGSAGAEALSFSYQTRSGDQSSKWMHESDWTYSYKALENNDNITYTLFQSDSTPTEVMLQVEAGIAYAHYDTTTIYDLLDLAGDSIGTPSESTQEALDGIESGLTEEFVETEINAVMDDATLSGSIFDAMLPLHQNSKEL